MALVLGDVVMSVGESFVRMIALALCLFELLYFTAKVGCQDRQSRLEVLHSGAGGSYSCGLKWPRSLSATFHTNATLSLRPSGAAMNDPLDTRVRTRHATEAVRQTRPQALQGSWKAREWAA